MRIRYLTLVVLLAGCSPTNSQTATLHAPGLRTVHSPGKVTDDEHLQAGRCHVRAENGLPLPDPACTPGAVDPAVTQSNIHTTICVKGYTATVRPPASDTGRWKVSSAQAYSETGVTGEYDHLVPLELGGANSTSNLWLQPGGIPNPKDTIENTLKVAVCAGKMKLADAQRRIATDWTK